MKKKPEQMYLPAPTYVMNFCQHYRPISDLSTKSKETFKKIADKNARDGGAAQLFFQLSKIFNPELLRTVMIFSGAERGAEKAVSLLSLKFNSLHLLILKVFRKKGHRPCKTCVRSSPNHRTCFKKI